MYHDLLTGSLHGMAGNVISAGNAQADDEWEMKDAMISPALGLLKCCRERTMLAIVAALSEFGQTSCQLLRSAGLASVLHQANNGRLQQHMN